MTLQHSFKTFLTAALAVSSLAGCGGSQDAAKPAAAPPLASGEGSAASPPAAGAPQSALPGAIPEPTFKVESRDASTRALEARKPIALVNGKPVAAERVYSMYQMNKEMLKQRGRELSAADDQALKAESLQVVLADELLYQAAVAKGVKAAPGEVDAAFKQFRARVGTEEAYKKFLATSGLTEAEVRHELERNFQTEGYRKGLVAGRAVSEEQAKKYYDANVSKGMFDVPEQVHVQYILVKATDKDPEPVRGDAKKRAEEAARRAAAGEDFSALAKQYSQDPTASRGGDIGLVPRGVMFPKFEEVAFGAKPGTVSHVFETPKGFNVMKVLERKPESRRSYDDVKQALMAEMGRVLEQDIVQGKIQELAAGAKIEVLDRSFAPSPPPPPSAPAPPPPKP